MNDSVFETVEKSSQVLRLAVDNFKSFALPGYGSTVQMF